MKEIYLILIALLAISFLVGIPSPEEDWYGYRGKLRMWQLYSEAESLKARALIYARDYIDRWLYRVNGSECLLDPPTPDGNAFISRMMEDWGPKGFKYEGVVNYGLFEASSEFDSDPLFAGRFRRGGIGLSLVIRATIVDSIFDMRARRVIETKACQPTAYYKARDFLDRIERNVNAIVRSNFRMEDNVTEALEEISRRLSRYILGVRSELIRDGISLSFSYNVDKRGYENYEDIVFTFSAMTFDGEAEYMYNGHLYRGFYCKRSWQLSIRKSIEVSRKSHEVSPING